MSLLLDGTNGLSDVDGTAATPAIRGTDANTGIFFPAADTIAFSEGGVEAMRITSAGDVGIGTSAPTTKLNVVGAGNPTITLSGSDAAYTSVLNLVAAGGGSSRINASGGVGALDFQTGGTDRARIDSSGNLLVGTLAAIGNGKVSVKGTAGLSAMGVQVGADGNYGIQFQNAANANAGFIQVNTSSTTYSTSSDYRLKENVAPMTGALATVAALKPVTYTWKADGSAGQGFIAHELQAVVPDCVTGAKDAVETVDDLDAEGRKIGTKEVPRYQGVDTSFLVATLVAAIQELKAEVDALKAG
jgi:hypothetical protein